MSILLGLSAVLCSGRQGNPLAGRRHCTFCGQTACPDFNLTRDDKCGPIDPVNVKEKAETRRLAWCQFTARGGSDNDGAEDGVAMVRWCLHRFHRCKFRRQVWIQRSLLPTIGQVIHVFVIPLHSVNAPS
jgi:hypothetical protein